MAATRSEVRLTQLSHGAGCACKIGAEQLGQLLDGLPTIGHPDLLVSSDTADDAAVYRLGDELAVVLTADFFTPIVDDPYDFGRVAAANALSDVYAMGARPLMALNLVAFSLEDLGREILVEILRGGADVAREAGAEVAGGHSIDDREPKYGMAVTGVVHPAELVTNRDARPGDVLFLTKPLGIGLISTAAKRDLAGPDLVARGIAVMTELNAAAARAAVSAGAHAMTDVTGFGLLGHLHELCAASGLGADVEAEAVPAIDGVLELASNERCVAGGTRRNAAHAEQFTRWEHSVPDERRVLITDAMTSGGLLVAVSPAAADRVPGRRIGRMREGTAGEITVV